MENLKILIGGIITLFLCIITLFTGYLLLIIPILIIGVITFILLLGSTGDISIAHLFTTITATLLFIVIIGISFLGNVSVPTKTDTYHEIYSVTAPFGVIWTNQVGEVHGGLFYTHGTFDSSLSETYIAKYMLGNQLMTITTNNPIIVDGKFTLQETTTTYYTYNTVWPQVNSNNLLKLPNPNSTTQWIIHIPSLPPTNQTGDNNYIVIP